MDWTKEIKEAVDKIPRLHKNIRTLSALKILILKVDRIPVGEIEKLAEKYE